MTKVFTQQFFELHEQCKEQQLPHRRISHQTVQDLLEQLPDPFRVNLVGHSVEGRAIKMVSVGHGPIHIMLWSQMHGDEPTATMALFDLLNFFKDTPYLQNEKAWLLTKVTLHFIPMLNPDGAERFQRRNALGIDLNRDAVQLASPEARILKDIRDGLRADYGFNLHDQSLYYSAGKSPDPAVISFLAPPADVQRSIPPHRERAMQLIVGMNEVLQQYIPGQVGRYDDTFEPRAFGDNIQKWGTSTILIESGGYRNDPEKQYIRKLNFVAILTALWQIGTEEYKKQPIAAYNSIPENINRMLGLKLKGLTYKHTETTVKMDIGITYKNLFLGMDKPLLSIAELTDLGDLSTYGTYEEVNAEEWTYQQGKVYPELFQDLQGTPQEDLKTYLKEGYTFFRVKSFQEEERYQGILPLLGEQEEVPSGIALEQNPTFILLKEGKVNTGVVNGKLVVVG
ncbi:M14 metallopeptidase family protein [Algivirga pacifica]|uniref:M14 family metallopeptidase n=1 Tax=Algivirga pacifica TaxID=1162670 RepID=A0ABP9DQU1_9BACT